MVEQRPRLDYSNNLQDGLTLIHEEPRKTLDLPFLKPKTKSRKICGRRRRRAEELNREAESESKAKSLKEIKGLFGL